MPLVARREPYRSRYRAGIGTLVASPGCRALHRASTLDASLDIYSKESNKAEPLCQLWTIRTVAYRTCSFMKYEESRLPE